ncbi:hypothetical protein D3875_20325 [Deinococcus cavernae]|uniref:Uncharacterized protein n=1 Tax=Deinococcus cavernae TaxID=2320857 RepID=A0A418V1U4_9DEIO|nr:hypothetical protein D3875_20325 [Deinococcus cavernae]
MEFSEDGQVRVGPAFRAAEKAWMQGVAHTARCGVNVIIDDVFLGGPALRPAAGGSVRPAGAVCGRPLPA